MIRSVVVSLSVVIIGIFPAGAQEEGLLGPEAIDAGLAIEQVANDLAFPMGMVALPDGSLFVATSPSDSGNFYDSTGEIVRLSDSDGDGSLDERMVVATDLPGTLVALARYENIVMLTSAEGGQEGIQFFLAGETWDEPLVELDRLGFGFIGAMHQSYALAVRPSADSSESFDLFYNLGAAGNDTDGANVRLSGLLTGVLPPSSVFMTTVTVGGGSVALAEPVQIASGLRNASALVIHPETGDLWIGENGIDGYEDPIVSFSADELNVIPADQIGTDVVDFGFPDSYIDYASGENINDDPAFVDFRPLDGSEAEGIAGMTLSPASFPAAFANGMIAGFHGQSDLTGLENEENPVRFINLETGEQIELIVNGAGNIGHLDSMTSTESAVYIADFCTGSMTSSAACGVIYRLSVADE